MRHRPVYSAVLAACAITIAALGAVVAPSTAWADLPVSTNVIAVIAPPMDWAGTVEPDGSLLLPPGDTSIPIFLENKSSSTDYRVDTTSPSCQGFILPRAASPVLPDALDCSIDFTGQPGQTGTLNYTFTEVSLLDSSDHEQTTLGPVAYRVADDRPVVTVSYGGNAVPTGGTVSMPLGSEPELDASVGPSIDGDIVSPASFVSPSPSACESVTPVDVDSTHTLDCAATFSPALQQPTSVTFAASDDSSYRTDVTGETTVSSQGSGGCTTNKSSVTVGATLTISCTGFEPGIDLTAEQHSTPTEVDSHILVPGSGDFTFSYTVPAGAGIHTVNILLGGTTLFTTDPFTVAGPVLAETGVTINWQDALMAASAIALGCALTALSRRRSRRRA